MKINSSRVGQFFIIAGIRRTNRMRNDDMKRICGAKKSLERYMDKSLLEYVEDL